MEFDTEAESDVLKNIAGIYSEKTEDKIIQRTNNKLETTNIPKLMRHFGRKL